MSVIIQIGNRAACDILKNSLFDHQFRAFVADKQKLMLSPPPGYEMRVEGKDAQGNEFWTTEKGLVYLIDSEAFAFLLNSYGGTENATQHPFVWHLTPTADWLHAFHQEFSLFALDPSLAKMLYKATEAGKAKEVAEREAYDEALDVQLRELGVPETKENRSFLVQVKYFDYTYHYTDDGAVWRNRKNQEDTIRKEMKDYPKFIELFDQGFKTP